MTLQENNLPVAKKFTVAQLAGVELNDAPIPNDWILSGTPHARSGPLAHSMDNGGTVAVWECTAGSFRWQFGWEETVVILEGSVTVIAESGETRVLREGDVAYFGPNTTAEWRIDSYVKKIAFMRSHIPSYVRKPLAFVRSARDGFHKFSPSFSEGNTKNLLLTLLGAAISLFLLDMLFEM